MSFRLILTAILSFAVLGVFLGLGKWQLDRLHWKEGVLDEIDRRIAAAPVDLPAQPDPDHDRFLSVKVMGTMGSETLRVLVSSRDAGAGYRLISPLTMEDGAILVDRGFIRVSDPMPPTPDGPVTVIGNLHWPDDRNSATPENEIDTNTWFARDIDQMADVLNTRPLLVIARQTTPTEPGILPMPVTSDGIPNDHLEYAVTWFLMAATWVVMTVFALWRMKRRTRDTLAPRSD
ncbi:SURF1-like protein [Aliiroseovarius zhejiangensis]|uniref:SURF1-like protein n=1 Tax=Aliiroseovarius zhejiangensis TaxID=1632025 RepID=A0ABQ3ITS4_9RHOB|nr:SURF1 family protein [Aliiroseovarius zhejiangensis]GHE91782.1 SURF1-like protein [Aliiroseovarius zhejiangensis]